MKRTSALAEVDDSFPYHVERPSKVGVPHSIKDIKTRGNHTSSHWNPGALDLHDEWKKRRSNLTNEKGEWAQIFLAFAR